MAEATAFIEPACNVVRCLWAPIAKRVNYARKLSKNWEVLCNKLSDLCTRKNDIDIEIERLKPQKTSTKECEDWKTKVMEMENRIEAMKAEFDAKKKCIGGLCPDIFARISLGEKVENMIDKIEELLEKAKFENGFLIDSPPTRVEKKPDPDSNLTYSAYDTLDKVLNKVQNKSTQKIGIWGMGGVGKTTVMQLLNNTPEISLMFDFVIWVTVSKFRSIKNLQEEVGKRLSMEIKNDEPDERVASKLLKKLEGKNYLLLLDDVWEEVDLSRVGFPNPNQDNGCKVVSTTRKLDVCRKMGTNFDINVNGLTKEEAWELFCSKVGDIAAESDTIRPFAKEIVEKCDGLPLALKVVGGALRKVENPNVWSHFLSQLNSPSTSSIEEVDEQVFKLLKLSYDRLKDVKKECLLYCGLFQEDKEIKKSQLIDYYIGEGILSRKIPLEKARVEGDAILQDLIDSSLLQRCEEDGYVKMHDLVRDLVLKITSLDGEGRTKHLVRAGTFEEKMPKDDEWEMATRISFIHNEELSNLPESPVCPKLLTLLLRGTNLEFIPETFFNNMPNLLVLDLSNTCIESLPTSISKLVSLRELLLVDCYYLKVLPEEISALKALQVLLVVGSYLDHCPACIFELTALRSLTFDSKCGRYTMKTRVLGGLIISSLSQMEVFHVRDFLEPSTDEDATDDVVRELSSCSSLSSLDFNFQKGSNLQYFLQNSRSWRDGRLTTFRFLVGNVFGVGNGNVFDPPLLIMNYNKILAYDGGREEDRSILPWVMEHLGSHLNFLHLENHGEITILSDLGEQITAKLMGFRVCRCEALENVVNRDGLEKDAFRNLKCLNLSSLSNLRCILALGTEGAQPPPAVSNSFTNLRELTLFDCPIKQLFSNGFMIQQLSNLETLIISGCDGLKGMISEDHERVEYEALPKLKIVGLGNLPEFVNFFEGIPMRWQSLEWVQIHNCPKLRKLPFGINNAPNLKKIECTRKWWDEPEWDNNAIKLRLQPMASFY